jgi:hypothetical protein
LPDLTPLRNVVRPIGSIGGIGGSALGLPIICQIRKNPVSGIWGNGVDIVRTSLIKNKVLIK